MATKSTLVSLFLLLLICLISNALVTAARVNNNFFVTKIQSNPTQLAETAISDCLAGAKHASATVSNLAAAGGLKPRESAAVKDCLVTVGDAVLELKRSLEAMKKGSGRRSGDQVSNVRTWVSAALADENTCMDGFASMDGEVKRKVRGEIVKVANLIGNALSVIKGLEANVSP